MNKEKYVKVCPKCGSTNISNDFSNAAKVRYGIELDKKCNSCGHNALSFPEILIKDLKKFKNNLKKLKCQA